jgi:hypothetical protein
VNYVEYVPARQGSYSSYNFFRKEGSDEGKDKPKNETVVIRYEGLHFFGRVRSEILPTCSYPKGYLDRITQLGVLGSFLAGHSLWERHLTKLSTM